MGRLLRVACWEKTRVMFFPMFHFSYMKHTKGVVCVEHMGILLKEIVMKPMSVLILINYYTMQSPTNLWSWLICIPYPHIWYNRKHYNPSNPKILKIVSVLNFEWDMKLYILHMKSDEGYETFSTKCGKFQSLNISN